MRAQPVKVRGVVASLRRHANSTNGNPNWTVVLEDGRQWRTVKDSQTGYTLTESVVGSPVLLRIEGGQIAGLVVNPTPTDLEGR